MLVSALCIAGLYEFSARALMVKSLLLTGKKSAAKLITKDKTDTGFRKLVHYKIEYEYEDYNGNTRRQEQFVSSRKLFDSLARGGDMEIVYFDNPESVSYPVKQLESDLNRTKVINGLLLVFWAVMAVLLI